MASQNLPLKLLQRLKRQEFVCEKCRGVSKLRHLAPFFALFSSVEVENCMNFWLQYKKGKGCVIDFAIVPLQVAEAAEESPMVEEAIA